MRLILFSCSFVSYYKTHRRAEQIHKSLASYFPSLCLCAFVVYTLQRPGQVYEPQRQELFEPQRHGGTEKRKHSVNQAPFTIQSLNKSLALFSVSVSLCLCGLYPSAAGAGL